MDTLRLSTFKAIHTRDEHARGVVCSVANGLICITLSGRFYFMSQGSGVQTITVAGHTLTLLSISAPSFSLISP